MTNAEHARWSKWHDALEQRPTIEDTIPDLLERASERWPALTLLTEPDGTEVTYADAAARASAFGSALVARGVEPGEAVALMLPNSTAYVVGFFGALRAGAAVVQLNPIYTAHELEPMLSDTDTKWLVVGAAHLEVARELRARRPELAVLVSGSNAALQAGELDLDAFLVSGEPHAAAIPVDRDTAVASYQFTGGTTGRSKGAMLTHANLLGGIQPTFDLILEGDDALPPGSRAVAAAPFFHIFGLTMVLFASVHHGWNLLLVPRPTPDGLVELVRTQRPDYLAGVATLFTAMVKHPEAASAGLDRVTLYTSGGASVPEALLREFEALSGRTLFEGYGLSEGAPVSFNTHLRGSVAGSIGIPIPGTEVRVVDPATGRETEPGTPGELRVRGPQVMQGYRALPDETARALQDGWLCTGDIATMDADGYLRIVDRLKDMINAAGYKVYPREIEEVVYDHSDVVEAAVVGVPDDYRGETVKLVLVARAGSELTAEAVEAHCRAQLAPYKVPRIIEFRDALPKSNVGKILRRMLRDDHAG